MIIPTRYKSKIPHTHSYPLGAEMISRQLGVVPQREIIELWFSHSHRFHRTYYQPNHEVFGLTYSKSGYSVFMSRRWHSGQRWKINVYAVPRILRHIIQQSLIAHALPMAREWFVKNAHNEGRTGHV